MNTIEIGIFSTNLVISKNRKLHNLEFDGQQGLFTRDEWVNEDLQDYNKEEQEIILSALESTYNGNFFADS